MSYILDKKLGSFSVVRNEYDTASSDTESLFSTELQLVARQKATYMTAYRTKTTKTVNITKYCIYVLGSESNRVIRLTQNMKKLAELKIDASMGLVALNEKKPLTDLQWTELLDIASTLTDKATYWGNDTSLFTSLLVAREVRVLMSTDKYYTATITDWEQALVTVLSDESIVKMLGAEKVLNQVKLLPFSDKLIAIATEQLASQEKVNAVTTVGTVKTEDKTTAKAKAKDTVKQPVATSDKN